VTDSSPPSTPDALPIGMLLGDFKITNVIGFGGFGMVYLAYEKLLDRTVAIKEYLPVSIAGRVGDQTVRVRSLDQLETYEAGLRSFVREAQLQARFSHPAMLEVYRVWEQNGTAYMAMRYYPGTSLRELRKAETTTQGLSEALIRNYLEPVCDAVRELHAQNVLHRDIAPDNILIMSNESPVLLDFGAARSVIAGSEQQLTTVLKPGYAPIEQYADDGAMAQGPWTDVYALGAVMYFLVMGTPPPQPVSRLMNESLRDFDLLAPARYSPEFIAVVRRALAVKPENRFQCVEDLCEALGWDAAPRTFFKTNTSVSQAARQSIAELEAALITARAVSETQAILLDSTVANKTNSPPVEKGSTPSALTSARADEGVAKKPISEKKSNEPVATAKEKSEQRIRKSKGDRAANAAIVSLPQQEKAQTSETAHAQAPKPVPVRKVLHARPRERRILWFAVPLVAAFSYAGYLVFDRTTVSPQPDQPARVEKAVEPITAVPPKPVEPPTNASKEAAGSSGATATGALNPPSATTSIEQSPVPSAPIQPAKERLPERVEKSEKKKTEPVVASASEPKKVPPARSKAAVEVSPARVTTSPIAQNSPACELLYAKLSLGSVELTSAEHSRLATCK
jgi:non-specific serine/threonine protein kinase